MNNTSGDQFPEAIKEAFNVQAAYETEPEKYVLQTLDDAALVLTVCRMSLLKAQFLPTEQTEVYMRLAKVRELLDSIDGDVAQTHYISKIIDSSIEGN